MPPILDPFLMEGEDPELDDGVREWLDPIGDTGFWITPDEPADPFDCDRYPRSIFCGNLGPGDLWDIRQNPTGFDFEFHRSSCEICVDIDTNLFYIPLPTFSVCYRSQAPGCQPPPPGGSPGGFSGNPTGDPFPPGCVRQFLFLVYIPQFLPRDNQPLPPPVAALHISVSTSLYPSGSVRPSLTDAGGRFNTVQSAIISGTTPNGEFWDLEEIFPQSHPDYPLAMFLGSRLLESQPASCNYVPPPPPPPPPPIRYNDGDDDGMCDCQETTDLLRLIAARLGVNSYPVSVPKTLNKLGGDDTQALESLTEFAAWFTYQMDSLIGEFPIDIEIEDIDPSQSGNQGVKVRLPNIAETLAEVYGLAVKSSVNSDIHTNFLMRLSAEMLATKNTALITQDYAKANADFLGYKGNPKKRKIPYSFNPKKLDSLEDILSSHVGEILGWESEAKDSVLEYLQKLMFAAGIIKSVYFRRAKDVARLMQEVGDTLDQKPEDRQELEDWRDFLESINDNNSNFNRNSPVKPRVVDPTIQPPENNGGGR